MGIVCKCIEAAAVSCKVSELQFLYMTILRSQIALFESQPRVRQGHQHLLPACSSIRTHLCVEATLCSAVFQCVAVSRQQNPLQLCGCDSLTLKRLKFLNFQNTPLESLRRNCRGSPTGSCKSGQATFLVRSLFHRYRLLVPNSSAGLWDLPSCTICSAAKALGPSNWLKSWT